MEKNFEELGLDKGFLKTIHELDFKEPSEIQRKSIPLALAGKDIIGKSSTGSGKTLAFGAGIIEAVKKSEGIQALVLTPTRELAEQVSKSLSVFSRFKKLKVTPIYGGVSIQPQIQNLISSDIVVGTPGRILDHISRRTINLSEIKVLVLDEADRMLDMGFYDEVKKIIERCPNKRQTMLFSATISHEILELSRHYMKNPVEVSVEANVDPRKLDQVFYEVYINQKFSLLVHLLKKENSRLVMVFCNTKKMVDVIAKNLKLQGINAMALHGDLSQNKRSRVLDYFHKSEKFVLVCTDVAARGLDIKDVSHVYNYDSPKTSTEYIHRIGRTARAGKEGKAITIICDRDFENFRRVKSDSSLNIKKVSSPEFESIRFVNSFNKKESREDRGNFDNRPRGERRNFDNRPRGERRNFDNRPRGFQNNKRSGSRSLRNFNKSRNYR
ncbi:MAG: DEAD/DEAH box helicase [Nanoarchaeota archaeon]